jgi:ADP-heptose:LPS heptosyltransferase
VLIVKPSSLGDVVTAMPVLRGIRRTFPQTHVSWLVARSCADLVRHDSALDEVILFDRRHLGRAWRSPRAAWDLLAFLQQLRRGKFDWVIDLQGLLRSALFSAATRAPVRCGFADAREGAATFYSHAVRVKALHTVERNLELAATLGIDARPEDFTLEVSPEGKAFAQEFLRAHGLREKEFIICVPPTRWPTKLYPVRHWRTVVGALASRRPVVLIGAPGDRELCEAILCSTGILPVSSSVASRWASGPSAVSSPSNPAKALAGLSGEPRSSFPNIFNLAGQTSVAQMVGLIAASGGVICSDSAAKFIAPAVGVNAVALLGPTRVEATGPYVPGPQVQAESIIAPVACQGCLKRRCRHCVCMELIEPQRVIDAAGRLFCL